jgi:hypothetical protein
MLSQALLLLYDLASAARSSGVKAAAAQGQHRDVSADAECVPESGYVAWPQLQSLSEGTAVHQRG